MRSPSGDHECGQLWLGSLVICSIGPPSFGMIPTCVRSPRLISTARNRPSGDHEGYVTPSASAVIRRRPALPSSGAVQTFIAPFGSIAQKATSRPSGDNRGLRTPSPDTPAGYNLRVATSIHHSDDSACPGLPGLPGLRNTRTRRPSPLHVGKLAGPSDDNGWRTLASSRITQTEGGRPVPNSENVIRPSCE